MSGVYASDGSMNITVVSGTTLTGTYASDGSINVVVSTGLVFVGAYHPCGAWWVTVAPSGVHGIRAPDGSLYVSETPFTNDGQRVTVVSGSLSLDSFLLLVDGTSFLLLTNGTDRLILAGPPF